MNIATRTGGISKLITIAKHWKKSGNYYVNYKSPRGGPTW